MVNEVAFDILMSEVAVVGFCHQAPGSFCCIQHSTQHLEFCLNPGSMRCLHTGCCWCAQQQVCNEECLWKPLGRRASVFFMNSPVMTPVHLPSYCWCGCYLSFHVHSLPGSSGGLDCRADLCLALQPPT